MSTTFTIDTSTSRAHPTPAPMKRLTVPAIQRRKVDGSTAEPLVMLTAYTVRMAQLLDPHCDLLLVGDSLGQVVYGLASTLPVTLDMMIAHGAAVVRGSYHAVVLVDMPFGSYEVSPEQAFASAAHVTKLSIRNNRVVVCAMEPRSAIGEWDAKEGRYILHVGSQGVFGLRGQMANDLLKVPVDKVRVVCDTLDEVYRGMRSRANLRDVDELLRLARWCRQYGLR